MFSIGIPHGTIKLSCPVALLQIYIQDILVDFVAKYPDINIQILAINRPVDVISEGLDLALRVRALPLDDSGLTMKNIRLFRRVLLLIRYYLQPTVRLILQSNLC